MSKRKKAFLINYLGAGMIIFVYLSAIYSDYMQSFLEGWVRFAVAVLVLLFSWSFSPYLKKSEKDKNKNS